MEPLKIAIYIVIIIITIAAVKTALPEAAASKPCLLGYKALCSFTPISTIILATIAVVLFYFSGKIT
ncbi:MAG TPA: hypothetical protein VLH35_00275 [Candidatus Acidoferrales bacterium]|nr:hypothetical protein [Candidatus Acidoferrales bacterium]